LCISRNREKGDRPLVKKMKSEERRKVDTTKKTKVDLGPNLLEERKRKGGHLKRHKDGS